MNLNLTRSDAIASIRDAMNRAAALGGCPNCHKSSANARLVQQLLGSREIGEVKEYVFSSVYRCLYCMKVFNIVSELPKADLDAFPTA